MNDDNPRALVLLSLQSALLGEISPNMSSVTCSWANNLLQVQVAIDCEINDEDKESLECIHSELLGLLPESWTVSVEFLELKSSLKPTEKLLPYCVFKRRDVVVQ